MGKEFNNRNLNKHINSELEDKAFENEIRDSSKIYGELLDENLEEIVGGYTTVVIPLCESCNKRIAVYQTTLCPVCFLKFK